MSLAVRVRCPTLRPSPVQSIDHIWISNDLLSSAFRRFTRSRSSKRHGSFVPGPLEARKRQARRRMVDVAAARGDGIVGALDTGAYLVAGGSLTNQSFQWQPPLAPARERVEESNIQSEQLQP